MAKRGLERRIFEGFWSIVAEWSIKKEKCQTQNLSRIEFLTKSISYKIFESSITRFLRRVEIEVCALENEFRAHTIE